MKFGIILSIGFVFLLTACAKNEKEVQPEAGGLSDRFANSKMLIEEVEYQERELSRSNICELKTVESYSGTEYREYQTSSTCRGCSDLTKCRKDMVEVEKLATSIDAAMATVLTRTAQSRMKALKSVVDAALVSFKTQIKLFEQNEKDVREKYSNQYALSEKFKKEFKVNLNVVDLDSAHLRLVEPLLSNVEFKNALSASGVRVLSLSLNSTYNYSLTGGGQIRLNPFIAVAGQSTLDVARLISSILAQPTKEQMNDFLANVSALGESGLKVDFSTIEFATSLTQLERIKGLLSKITLPAKYPVELSTNGYNCYLNDFSKVLNVGFKLTDERFIGCLNNHKLY